MSQPTKADTEKRLAGAEAVKYVQDGMILGLGSGSTFEHALKALAQRVADEGLNIKGVPSSERTRRLAESYGITTISFSPDLTIDLTIDGADEVDENGTLIKGGGGALLREKIVAYFSRQVLIAVDSSKLVRCVGRFPLPVEVVPFGLVPVTKKIEQLGVDVKLRLNGQEPYVTDNGNYILDCSFGEIEDAADLDQRLKQIPGVVETGLFIDLLDILVVGRETGAEVTTRRA